MTGTSGGRRAGDGAGDGAGGGSGLPAHLRERLAADAGAHGLLDVAYRTLDTPIGTLLLAATPVGIVRVAYPCEEHDQVLARLAELVSPRVLHAPGRLDEAARELEDYFAGRRAHFDLPLDLRLSHGFRATVLAQLRRIAYGSTASYAAVAAAVGNPAAVRAVGSACATNPLPVLVACHRVIRSDGSIGRYGGGVEAKRALLDLESTAPRPAARAPAAPRPAAARGRFD